MDLLLLYYHQGLGLDNGGWTQLLLLRLDILLGWRLMSQALELWHLRGMYHKRRGGFTKVTS